MRREPFEREDRGLPYVGRNELRPHKNRMS